MRAWLALCLIMPLAAWAQAGGAENQVPLPEYPKAENYLPLEVSETTSFSFFVDAKSISVGSDGVVRYSLIAKSPDGALNISHEGIRCSGREFRVYAFGRSDNTWSESRVSRWQPIPSDTRNAQRSVLYREFLCPLGSIIQAPEEGVQALRRGGHPRVTVPRI